MTWSAPTAQRWITHRVCLACEAGQRTAPHEPCWSCHGPTVDGVLWPAGAGLITDWPIEVGR